MTSRIARRLAAVAAAAALCAVAGCASEEKPSGGSGTQASSAAPAPDADRTRDLVPLTTAQAVRKAQRIALVTARGSRVVEGAPGTPFTRTRFTVRDVVKGALPREFVLQVIGGKLGNTRVDSPVQDFIAGRRYIVFLGPDGPAGPTIFPQAVLEVKRAGGADVVQPAPRGIPLLAAGSSKPAHPLDAGPRLDDVIFSLGRYARTGRGSP